MNFWIILVLILPEYCWSLFADLVPTDDLFVGNGVGNEGVWNAGVGNGVGNGLVDSIELVLWLSESVVSIAVILSFVIELIAPSTEINKLIIELKLIYWLLVTNRKHVINY